MGLFHKKPTPAQKREIEAALSRSMTCCRRLESLDSIDKYFTEWDKYLSEEHILEYYEDQRIKFNVSPRKIHSQICAEIPRIEKDIITRGYDRMQRDAAKLSTNSGKKKKAEKFFSELEFYYPRLNSQSVELINQLRSSCQLLNVL
ncbi:MAG: hypothetical protein IKX68_06395 [Clostridiales bacterium]|nr:hypothetical protein [Clostridiales bacterium]